MGESLKNLNCEPCPPDGKALSFEECEHLLEQLSEAWEISESEDGFKVLSFTQATADFKESLEKANLIGKMADEEWHHPEILVAFKSLKVEIHTHVIKGLRKADFIFAAKVDDILSLTPRTHFHNT